MELVFALILYGIGTNDPIVDPILYASKKECMEQAITIARLKDELKRNEKS